MADEENVTMERVAPASSKPMVTRSAWNRLQRDLEQAKADSAVALKRVKDVEAMIAGVQPEPEPVKTPRSSG